MELSFHHLLLLLGIALASVLGCRRMGIPTSLGYLFAGVLLGPHTMGPSIDDKGIPAIAEFGIVFLLFSSGLSFSPAAIYEQRKLIGGLGTAQVAVTTACFAVIAWLAGATPAAAFVLGAVVAQSSTSVIGKQLAEQDEENSPHGRLALSVSIFQDVTAVPFIVIIPVLGSGGSPGELGLSLTWALCKAALAIALVLLAGRRLLPTLFRFVAKKRSAELFTLTVLFVSLIAAWTTNQLGLSLAFGAFLAGMLLGETEFRHQVEAAIRPFRDVLLGLFFVSIGMLFDPRVLLDDWHWCIAGAILLLAGKAVIFAPCVRYAGLSAFTSVRVAILVAVGGEFGFALLAVGLNSGIIAPERGQIALTAVLLSIMAAPFLMRYNHALAYALFGGDTQTRVPPELRLSAEAGAGLREHVIICGFGRIGQSVGRFLEEEQIDYIALDLETDRVREGRRAGYPVFFGDSSEPDVLSALSVDRARLAIISHDDTSAALRTIEYLQQTAAQVPVMVRTRDESDVRTLQEAGAAEVVPETLEASLMIALQVLLMLKVPPERVLARMQKQRSDRYMLLRELSAEDSIVLKQGHTNGAQRLHPVRIGPGSKAHGRTLAELESEGFVITALVRDGKRSVSLPADLELRDGDVLVLFGTPAELQTAEERLGG